MIQSQIQIESSSNGTCELLNTVKSNYFGFYSSFLHLISVRKRKSANMENFDNYSSFNHLSEDLMYVKRAPNVRFREGYGMAEMSPAVTFTRLQVEQTGGSCGQLLSNTNMEVLDLVTEEEKGPGETGELCFQGPQVMPGYITNECNNRSAFFGANNTVTGEVNI